MWIYWIWIWNVVTNDNRNIFIGTIGCKIIKFSMDEIQNATLKSIKLQNDISNIKKNYVCAHVKWAVLVGHVL